MDTESVKKGSVLDIQMGKKEITLKEINKKEDRKNYIGHDCVDLAELFFYYGP